MEVDEATNGCRAGAGAPAAPSCSSGRWRHLARVLERPGPFASGTFQPSPELLPFVRDNLKLLVVGAGGLGCELLKNLALMGFRHIHVIDMDTIDMSNLNRQFLFRPGDVGKSKAEVAAAFINKRVPGVQVVPHNCMIQDYDEDFYRQFMIIVCGLDSIVARRWINSMVLSLLEYNADGSVDQTTVRPIIDGGTEGFKGNARVIYPGMSACIECTLDLFPPQVNFPLCTIAHTPRLPEHCIEYVRILLWAKENPFGEIEIDGDDPQHINWIFEKAQERAAEYKITGVSYRLTHGVIKHIIPAVASTNAVIAAACALEVFKVATSCAPPLNNYMVFNESDGIYTYSYEAAKNDKCLACSRTMQVLTVKKTDKLKDFIDFLTTHALYQMKAPGLTSLINGRNKTLYMSKVASIEAATKQNLKKTLPELGLTSGSVVVVADPTTPTSVEFRLELVD